MPWLAMPARRLLLFFLFISSALIAAAQWTTSGANIYNSNTGNVGIGTTTPNISLRVVGQKAATDYDGKWGSREAELLLKSRS